MLELVEQVLLRFPPDDPACLVRAALVRKRWCRLIAGRGFRRRFREFHGAAPMLGFVCNFLLTSEDNDCCCKARLVPTSSCLSGAEQSDWLALDSRHGRVLLCIFRLFYLRFAVWCPVTGERLELPALVPDEQRFPWPASFSATVLCAGGAPCDHVNCHDGNGAFLVVLVFTCVDGRLFTSIYSSDAGAWSEPAITFQPPGDCVDSVPAVPAALVGSSLYFVFVLTNTGNTILKYDMGTRETSIVQIPPPASHGRIILMTTEQGKLGFTRADDFKLYLWSMEVGAQGDMVWTQDRVIELQNLLPADVLLTPPDVVGCVNGRGVVLVRTGEEELFKVDAKHNRAMKVEEGTPCKKDDDVDTGSVQRFITVFPYTGFYFPALGAVLLQRSQLLNHQVLDVN